MGKVEAQPQNSRHPVSPRPITVAARSKSGTVFARLKAGHGCLYCLRLFCVCVVVYVHTGLAPGCDPPSKECYLLCIGSRN
jgi:hypothetical protein